MDAQRARHRAGTAVVVLALVGATLSCSSSGQPRSAKPLASPGSGSPTSSPSASPTSDRSTGRMPREQVEELRVKMPGGGGPDWLASGFGSLWVRRDSAAITRVAPDGTIEAEFDAGIFQQPVCQGLGVSHHAVWGCATSGRMVRIDPGTNKIAAIVDVPKINDQGRLVSFEDRVWFLTGDGDRLVGVSEDTNRPGSPIRLGTFCTDVADRVRDGVLWVACAYKGVVLRVDLRKRKVTGRVTGLPQASAISAAREVWVGFRNGLAQVNPRSLRVMSRRPAAAETSMSVRAYDDRVWVRETGTTSHFLMRVDPRTGRTVQVISTDGVPSGGDVVEFGGGVWVSSYEEGFVAKLRPPKP